MKTPVLALVASLWLAVPVASAPFSSFVSFGDSLSDDGKGLTYLLPNAPYTGGAFSNGPIWTEIVASEFQNAGLSTANYAVGGATAGDVNELQPAYELYDRLNPFDRLPDIAPLTTFNAQIDQFTQFLSGGEAGDNPLVSVFFGANDIFQGDNPFAAAGAVIDGIARLASLAPELDDFLVSNLPRLGAVPSASTPVQDTFSTLQFNFALEFGLRALEAQGLNIIRLDNFALFDTLLADPGALGITNTTDACFVPRSGDTPAFNCSLVGFDENGDPIFDPTIVDSFLFIDGVHPTATLHNALAQEALSLIGDGLPVALSLMAVSAAPAAVPLPAGMPLLLVGLGAFIFIRRKPV